MLGHRASERAKHELTHSGLCYEEGTKCFNSADASQNTSKPTRGHRKHLEKKYHRESKYKNVYACVWGLVLYFFKANFILKYFAMEKDKLGSLTLEKIITCFLPIFSFFSTRVSKPVLEIFLFF